MRPLLLQAVGRGGGGAGGQEPRGAGGGAGRRRPRCARWARCKSLRSRARGAARGGLPPGNRRACGRNHAAQRRADACCAPSGQRRWLLRLPAAAAGAASAAAGGTAAQGECGARPFHCQRPPAVDWERNRAQLAAARQRGGRQLRHGAAQGRVQLQRRRFAAAAGTARRGELPGAPAKTSAKNLHPARPQPGAAAATGDRRRQLSLAAVVSLRPAAAALTRPMRLALLSC
jgi:hypothetical protein